MGKPRKRHPTSAFSSLVSLVNGTGETGSAIALAWHGHGIGIGTWGIESGTKDVGDPDNWGLWVVGKSIEWTLSLCETLGDKLLSSLRVYESTKRTRNPGDRQGECASSICEIISVDMSRRLLFDHCTPQH